MNKKNTVFVVAAVAAIVAVIVAVYFYYENKKKDEEIKDLEENNLKLILESLRSNDNISDQIRLELTKLIERFETIEPKISREIAQAIQLIQIGQKENAIEDLVKIIEHLLQTHYNEDTEFKSWLRKFKKQKSLHNMLIFCKEENKISDIEFQFFIAIKTIRNKEDHTLDLNIDNYLTDSGLMTAIWGIVKISDLVYAKVE